MLTKRINILTLLGFLLTEGSFLLTFLKIITMKLIFSREKLKNVVKKVAIMVEKV